MIDNIKKPIVYFGRLAESKGVSILIKAYYILHQKGISNPLWVIGGNDIEIEALRKATGNIAHDLESKGCLFWWGHLPHNILPYILRKCLFSCFTSEYEPGGRTILEAMACQLPVLATYHGFAKEVIIDKVNGVIIKISTPENWAEEMILLLNNEKLIMEMGRKAKEIILQNFSMDSFNKKHWQVYLDVLT